MRKPIISAISLAVFVAIFTVVSAQEKITLTVPVYIDPGATEFRVGSLYLNRVASEIRAQFNEVEPGTAIFVPNGKTLNCFYAGGPADTLLIALNKANLSTKSLERRVTEQCQADGKLGAGTISGVPQ